MAKPVVWLPDPSGGVEVILSDGSSHVVDPKLPVVQQVMATLPKGTPRTPEKPDVWSQDAAMASAPPAPPTPSAAPPWARPTAPTVNKEQAPTYANAPVVQAPTTKTVIGHDGKPHEVAWSPAAPPSTPETMAMDPSKRVVIGGAKPDQAQEGAGLPRVGLIPGTPGRLVKGGMMPHSQSVQEEEGYRPSEEALAMQQAADASMQQGATASIEAEREKNRLEGQWKEQQSTHEMLAADERKKREGARSDVEQQVLADYDAAKVIDPDRLWNSKTGWEKFSTKLGVALGAFVSVYNHTGKNSVLDQLNHEIEQDVQAQMANAKTAGDDVQRMYGMFDREDAKIAAGEAAHYEAAVKQLDGWLEGVRDQKLLANGAELRGKLMQEATDRRERLEQLVQGKKVTTKQAVQTPDRVVGGTPTRIDTSRLEEMYAKQGGSDKDALEGIEAYKKTHPGATMDEARYQWYSRSLGGGGQGLGGKGGTGNDELYVAWAGGNARSPNDASKLRDIGSSRDTVLANLDRIQEIRNATYLNRLSPSAKAEVEALQAANRVTLGQLYGLGALSKDDLKQVEPLSGEGALDLWSPGVDAQIAMARRVVSNKAETAAKAYGITPAQERVRGGAIQNRATATSAPVVQQGTTRFKPVGQ